MLDQTQNQSGTLQKGTETKDKSEPKDQHSKAARLRTLNEERDAVHKAWQRTRNIYGYSQQKPKPKRDMKKERKEYEKKYLARYKEPKAKPKKSSNLKYDDDLGGIKLRKHFGVKRREHLAKRKEYEVKYIKRYMKKLESEPKQSSSKKFDHDLISGRFNFPRLVSYFKFDDFFGLTFGSLYLARYFFSYSFRSFFISCFGFAFCCLLYRARYSFS